MSPILKGVVASQITGHLSTNSYESIATVTLSSASNTITFSSIPAGYKHLQLRSINLSTGINNNVMLRFNSDSGSNYSEHALVASGSAASSYSTTNATFSTAGYTANSTYPGASVCDIFDYSSTVKNKTVRAISSNEDNNTDAYITFNASAWYNTSAINRIDVIHGNIAGGKVFNTYSSFALYGIKG
jgi:hypothetical protein